VAVFLLGPSKWVQGFSPPTLPAWLHEHLPKIEGEAGSPSPLAIRISLAARAAMDGHKIVVMESNDDVQGETRTGKFARLVRDQEVSRFALYWPHGANRSGLDVEIGFVLERLRRRELTGEDVRVLVEDDGAQRRAGGREPGLHGEVLFVSYERGHRTRYYSDLVLYGSILPTWADYGELLELVENLAEDWAPACRASPSGGMDGREPPPFQQAGTPPETTRSGPLPPTPRSRGGPGPGIRPERLKCGRTPWRRGP
jgi:hypothetical protein